MNQLLFNDENAHTHRGGPALRKAMQFVAACRLRDPLGNYPHIGDLQWWCRSGVLDEQENWHFWQRESGETTALAVAAGNEIFCLLHPAFHTRELSAEVRQWAIQRVRAVAQHEGERQYEICEEAADDEPEMIDFFVRERYTRQEMYFHRYWRPLSELVPLPILPDGFSIRSIAGGQEAALRAALQRDAFFPHSSKTYELGTERQLAIMQMPYYDPRLDLMVVAPDGTPAAGCVCWLDPVNRVGLFEPVGTRPQFRRRGVATALMLGGLQRLREMGMQAALVTGAHPGDEAKSSEFTSSRFVYEAVGFQLLRRTYTYSKVFSVE